MYRLLHRLAALEHWPETRSYVSFQLDQFAAIVGRHKERIVVES